jgi:hypothetical protein
MWRAVGLLGLYSTLTVACGDELSRQPFCADSQPPASPATEVRTWYEHAAPIGLTRCANGHAPDGRALASSTCRWG